MPEVEHRRLGEAADDLVGARDDEVRAEARARARAGPRGTARCAPHASSTTSGTPCACATSASAGHVRDRAEVGRRHDRRARPRPGLARARGRAPRGSCSARCRAPGRSPAPRTSAAAPTRRARRSCSSARCAATTTLRRGGRASSSATWLPCEAPLIRNQVRCAPQASAASCWASLERRRLRAHVDALGERRDVERQRALAERLDAARGRRRARPCARARGSGPARGRRTRAARRGRACRTGAAESARV